MSKKQNLNEGDRALRPQRLEDYVGQESTKELLRVAIQSAKLRGDRLEHVLLNGPPGLGKTTLARIIANEMGWNVKATIGASLRKVDSIKNLFFGIEPGTVVFIDEIHRMTKPIQEIVYPVLEDGVLYWSFGGTQMETKLEPNTVIGATTHIGKLSEPFQERFGLHLQLDYYGPHELVQILRANAEKLGMVINLIALEAIAKRSRGTPRTANRILRWVRDFRLVGHEELVPDLLWLKFRIDGHGLNPMDRRVLRILQQHPEGTGIENLAALSREAEETITGRVEPYLMAIEMLERTGSGRVITQKGIDHLSRFKNSSS